MNQAVAPPLAGSILGRGFLRTAWALLRRPLDTLRDGAALAPALRFLLATALVLGSSHLIRFLPLFWPSSEDGRPPAQPDWGLLVVWVVQLAVPVLGLALDTVVAGLLAVLGVRLGRGRLSVSRAVATVAYLQVANLVHLPVVAYLMLRSAGVAPAIAYLGLTVSVLHRAWIAAQVGRLAAARDGVIADLAWIPALLTLPALWASEGAATLAEHAVHRVLGGGP